MSVRRFTGMWMMGALLLSGCQTMAIASPATLSMSNATSVSKLKLVLAKALKVGKVELGPYDLTTDTTVSVLPPPLGPHETHSPALPIVFDITSKGGKCFVVRRDTQAAYELTDIACAPVKP